MIPILWVSLQTIYRFIFWDTTNAQIVEFIRTGSSGSRATDYFRVEYEVDGHRYSVKSDVGVSAGGHLRRKLKEWKTVSVLFNPHQPNESTVKYRHGQLYKLLLIWFVCGAFFLIMLFVRKS